MRKILSLAVAFAASTAVLAAPASAAELPEGMTAGYVVLDRRTGETVAGNEHHQYRSASLVKLFIALDYLESHGPDYEIPADDLALLEPMLRSSNDDAASVLWVRDGWEEIVNRMVAKIGLTDTTPPPAEKRGTWGYTAVSAADVAKTYEYILEKAHPKFRDFIMDNLEQATKCADDGFDQSFGIPSALPRPGAVKQGWSGFGAAPAPGEECVPANTKRVLASPEARSATELASSGDVDLTSRVMHTSGTADRGDRRIVVVLTSQPTTLSWADSADRITDLTREAYRSLA
ncbi:hypothetical protein L1857_00750 [Amycolatopsis thermalba]|uniref:Lipoprotein n=1 Tax=Amycolatopsis thermalba TaxID=944492 RepID=A0ABY4NPY5_9PSEU|nr:MULTISPECIES: hypothetical protein [Amycolatopsis]UQS21457.1 hypothetical protein L1857_00750 [Amycolatopsis thermalba]